MSVTRQNGDSVPHRPKAASGSTDRRARRTHHALDAAFASLLFERPYEDISVAEIAARADVGRATFYAHHASKDALLRSQFTRLAEYFIVLDTRTLPPRIDATGLFEHVRQARAIHRAVMSGSSGAATARLAVEAFGEFVLEALRRADADTAARRSQGERAVAEPLVAWFVASTLVGLLGWWSDHHMLATPTQMQTSFETLVGTGLRGALAPAAGQGQ